MKSDLYRCVSCYGKLFLDAKNLICVECETKYPVVSEIPRFLPPQSLSNSTSLGLASRLFESPSLYDWLIGLKTFVAPDQALGIRDLSDGRSLLNIGCGSNVERKHLEYDIQRLSNFAGVDVSPEFVEAARKNCSRVDSDFCVASIDRLPYDESTFDVVLIPFVLHHLPFSFNTAIREALRVARNHVIVFDHVKSDKSFLGAVQQFYWNTFDGGHQYLTDREWRVALKANPSCALSKPGRLGGTFSSLSFKRPA